MQYKYIKMTKYLLILIIMLPVFSFAESNSSTKPRGVCGNDLQFMTPEKRIQREKYLKLQYEKNKAIFIEQKNKRMQAIRKHKEAIKNTQSSHPIEEEQNP